VKRRTALGFSVHTGWAAMVAVSDDGGLVDRRRIEMFPGPYRFVYHAVQDKPLAVAQREVAKNTALSDDNAVAALRAAVAELGAQGCKVVASGVIVGNQPLTASLAEILASHPLLHTAEGAMYRESIRRACAALRIPVTAIPARQVKSSKQVDAIGKTAGRPWAKDQRDACAAALMALAE
jgi:hypothetical protein